MEFTVEENGFNGTLNICYNNCVIGNVATFDDAYELIEIAKSELEYEI
tara:strand:+ start:1123 stop:1266 length:144 start_codon:yes stop_codon:yes gene_type:complete